jgi:carbamoyl-phosphate synthase small subunit
LTTDPGAQRICLELEDGTRFEGRGFGHPAPTSGEVVFTTGMVGYVESLTDPSYRGQILVFTYPLIGNYGVPARTQIPDRESWESDRIQVAGVVVASAHSDTSHAGAATSLPNWLADQQIPGIEGVDTRALTIRLREHGTMLGRIAPVGQPTAADTPMFDPNRIDIVSQVTIQDTIRSGTGQKRVVLVDCGVKNSIRAELLARGVELLQVPYDCDYTGERFDGILISNGPGNPEQCQATIKVLRRAMALNRPIFGICLGAQLMALAAGAKTYKLRYGHRGQNQPCLETGTDLCRLSSQNHGFAIDAGSLPEDWLVWFTNANDGSVEGVRHRRRPFAAVQFHPEASPGPQDTRYLFDEFVRDL